MTVNYQKALLSGYGINVKRSQPRLRTALEHDETCREEV